MSTVASAISISSNTITATPVAAQPPTGHVSWLAHLLQFVVPAVVGIEAVLPNIPGKDKKTTAINVIAAAGGIAGMVPNPIAQMIGAAIDAAVSSLNSTGQFTNKPLQQGIVSH